VQRSERWSVVGGSWSVSHAPTTRLRAALRPRVAVPGPIFLPLQSDQRRVFPRYIDGIEAGLAHVNVHTGYKEPSMRFGGVKQSGAGLPENSESGLEAFVDRKAVYLRG
jgi:Aldehyde dehydrogenase family